MELESWWLSLRRFGRVARPSLRGIEVRSGTPPVRVLRVLCLAIGAGLMLTLVVLLQLDIGERRADGKALWLWAVISPLSVAAHFWFRRVLIRDLITAPSPGSMVQRYRTRMIILIAFGETPALLAFATAFIAGTIVPYQVSLPVSLFLIALASPRAADVAQLQERINERGGTVDLAAALMGQV